MRILLIVHGFPPAASGGTEVYVHDLAAALAADSRDEVFVLTRQGNPALHEYAVTREQQTGVNVIRINNTFQACASFEESYTNPAIQRIAAGILDQVRPDVVHVQHLTCLSTGILAEAAGRDIPLLMTLNDFWMICHRGQLLDLQGQRCDGPFDGGCAGCLQPGLLASPAAYRAGRMARALPFRGAGLAVHGATRALERTTPAARMRKASAMRLARMREAAAHVDLFLAPSATIAKLFFRFGVPPTLLMRCEQGIDVAPFAEVQRTESPVLRAGFAGALIPSKAPHVLLEAAACLPAGSISLDLFGAPARYHGDGAYEERLAPLLGAPFVHRLGPIPHERMPAALSRIDVLVVPSIWLENAPFIIREAFAAGVPVVASALGGMAEMVGDNVDGLLFPAGDVESLAHRLRRLLEEPGLLQKLRAGIRTPMAITEDAANLRGIYERMRRPAAAAHARPGMSKSDDNVAAVVLNYRTPAQTWLAVRSLQASFRPPARVIVTDNGSADGSDAWLRLALEGVDVLQTGRNLGFSGGCNAGIRAALRERADFVLLMNSDVVLAPGALGALLDTARDHPGAGVIAPVLLSRDEPDRIASAGISFSARTGRMRHRGAGLPLSLLDAEPVTSVDAVSGCVMLVRRAVFESAGLFDEDYFFSFEDIDFCLRARAAGFDALCTSDALAYHEGGCSIGRRSPRRVYFATRNHLRLAGRMGQDGPAARVLRGGVVVGLNAAYVLLAPDAPLGAGLAAVVRGAWHHVLGRYGAD
jgi:GT2 family glycosyltransferase/glycosyltransferase involved in cell wall biosynthesis